jgi:hypothetical protein
LLSHFELVKELTEVNSALRSLAIRIIRQYAILLLLPFHRRLDATSLTGVLKRGSDRLREKLDTVRKLWEETPDDANEQLVGPGWVAASIFSPVFAALASLKHFWLNGALTETATDNEKIKSWRKTCKNFLPQVATFDKSYCLVGESQPYWPNVKSLQQWEQALRDARFSSSIRLLLFDGRDCLKKSGCVPDKLTSVEQSILFKEGQAAIRGSQVHAAITATCSGSEWFALRLPKLRPID